MKKIYYNKLIRDKVPENIKAFGKQCEVKILSKQGFVRELVKKLKEEAGEVVGAKNKKELVDELSDVVDVIDEIKRVKKITAQDIRLAQKNNNKKKGGFKKRIFLVWSSNDKYKTNEIKYGKK